MPARVNPKWIQSVLLLLSFCFGCFANPSVYGPDVIPYRLMDSKLNQALAFRALTLGMVKIDETNMEELYLSFGGGGGDDYVSSFCTRSAFYAEESVFYCEQMILNIQAQTEEDLVLQYLMMRVFICELDRIQVFNDKYPLQGEINICTALGGSGTY